VAVNAALDPESYCCGLFIHSGALAPNEKAPNLTWSGSAVQTGSCQWPFVQVEILSQTQVSEYQTSDHIMATFPPMPQLEHNLTLWAAPRRPPNSPPPAIHTECRGSSLLCSIILEARLGTLRGVYIQSATRPRWWGVPLMSGRTKD